MDFHFLVMEKSWKFNVEKEGAPWRKLSETALSGLVTFWPLNGVIGQPCDGLSSGQFSACQALPFST